MLTTYASTASATVQRWAEKLWIETQLEIYWGKFMKENTVDAIIEVKRDLEGKPGDKLTYTLLRQLTGAGVSGDSQLEDNEEQMVTYDDTLTLDQVRNAVRLAGRLKPISNRWP